MLQQRHVHQNHSKNQLTLTHSNSFADMIILKTNKTVTNTAYSCQSCYEFLQLYVQLLFLVDICSQIINSVFKLLNVQLKRKPSSTHQSSRDQVLFQKKREDVCAQTSTDSLPQDQVKGLHACLSPDPFLHNCICSDLTWLSSFKLHGEHYLRKQERPKGDFNWVADFPGGRSGCTLKSQHIISLTCYLISHYL